jgi:hypothetical protein
LESGLAGIASMSDIRPRGKIQAEKYKFHSPNQATDQVLVPLEGDFHELDKGIFELNSGSFANNANLPSSLLCR